MPRAWSSRALFTLVLLFSLAGAARAQFETASVVGTVRDTSGGVVPDAKVTLTNTATGVSVTRNTTGEGAYESHWRLWANGGWVRPEAVIKFSVYQATSNRPPNTPKPTSPPTTRRPGNHIHQLIPNIDPISQASTEHLLPPGFRAPMVSHAMAPSRVGPATAGSGRSAPRTRTARSA